MAQWDDAKYAFLTAVLRDFDLLINDTTASQPQDKIKRVKAEVLLAYSLGFASQAQTITASGTVTLVDADKLLLTINPSGADRDVKLPTIGDTNHAYFFTNPDTSYSLTIKKSDASVTYVVVAPGETRVVIPTDAPSWAVLSSGGGAASASNIAVNGGFDVAQRQAPGTLTTIADKTYGPDQWWVTRENADVQYNRNDGTAEAGIASKYFGTFKKITNAGKFFICQPLEGITTVPLRSQGTVFQIKLKASSSKTIRMAILELQNAGTMDAPPATLVTAFNADGTDPTFGTNVAIITSAESKSVTTSFQAFSVKKTIPSNSKNLFLAIWTDADFAVNDTLSVAEADFFLGSATRTWATRLFVQELDLCQRYCWKSFGLDVAPAQNAGLAGAIRSNAGKAGAVAELGIMIKFPVQMFASPTFTTYNPSAANAQVRDSSAAVDCSAVAISGLSDSNGFSVNCTGNAGTTVGNALDVHVLAEAKIL